jgi:glutamate/tyrosine decarboxylase-like PLP-dependent enzyme
MSARSRPAQPAAATDQTLDPADWGAFRQLAHDMLDAALDSLQQVRQGPVWRPVPDAVKQALAEPLPREPQGSAKTARDCLELVLPYTTGNTHPRFFGWVHGSGTPGGVVAEMLAAAMNANVGGRDHGAVYVERQVIEWCRELFGFPADAGGLLVSGTSMAHQIALTVARNHQAGRDVRLDGIGDVPLVAYTSVEAHGSIAKTVETLGLGRRALRAVAVDEARRIDIAALRKAIEADRAKGLRPFCVVATAGTVNTGAIDDLAAVAAVCKEFGLWFHVDGAFGALAILSDALAPLLAGIEQADSIAFDFHKWLHVPYDAGCVLIRDRELQLSAFSARPAYLAAGTRGLAGANPWFCEFGPEMSRGFRALKVWFTLKEHGTRRLGEKIEENCRQAAYLAERIRRDPHLALLASGPLSVVCFRYLDPGMPDEMLDRLNEAIVADLQEQGIAAPSTTRIDGRLAIRVAITNHRSRLDDFDLLLDAVLRLGAAGAR